MRPNWLASKFSCDQFTLIHRTFVKWVGLFVNCKVWTYWKTNNIHNFDIITKLYTNFFSTYSVWFEKVETGRHLMVLETQNSKSWISLSTKHERFEIRLNLITWKSGLKAYAFRVTPNDVKKICNHFCRLFRYRNLSKIHRIIIKCSNSRFWLK